MGVSLHYSGRSAVERRLQASAERQGVPLSDGVAVLLRRRHLLFLRRPLCRQREDIVQDVISRQQKLLGPEPVARRMIEEFRQEVERARISHPGVAQRACSLEKTGFLVQERLSEACATCATMPRHLWSAFFTAIRYMVRSRGRRLTSRSSTSRSWQRWQVIRPASVAASFPPSLSRRGQRCWAHSMPRLSSSTTGSGSCKTSSAGAALTCRGSAQRGALLRRRQLTVPVVHMLPGLGVVLDALSDAAVQKRLAEIGQESYPPTGERRRHLPRTTRTKSKNGRP